MDQCWLFVYYRSHAATPATIVNTWSRHGANESVRHGYYTVASSEPHFYVSKPELPYSNMWIDLSVNISAKNMYRLLGGEFSMWSNSYCYIKNCYQTNGTKPVAHWMYDRKEDHAFASSVTAIIWPRGIVAAGAFWNFQLSLLPDSIEFLSRYHTANRHLISRGIGSCPSECRCDELSQCGKLYPHTKELTVLR